MARIALWMEGAHHPFDEIREWQRQFLERQGHEVFFADVKELLSASPPESDLWILGGLCYSDMGDSYTPLTDEEARRLSERAGRDQPLLSNHSVLGSWDERKELDQVWDGRWNWETSRHSPVGPFPVKIADPFHPLTGGMSDFVVTDELYYNLTEPRSSHVVLVAEYDGRTWPLAWVRGRHVYFGLGHDLRSWRCDGTRRFFGNAVRYLLDQES